MLQALYKQILVIKCMLISNMNCNIASAQVIPCAVHSDNTGYVFQCLLFHDIREESHVIQKHVCGVINTGLLLKSHTWHLTVPQKLSLYIDFHHFHLPSAPFCKGGTVVHVKPSAQTKHTYCGHRMPWHLSFLHSQATVQCRANDNRPNRFHFVMTFQAFDASLPSVVLMERHEIDEFFHRELNKNISLTFLEIGQKYNTIKTVHLHTVVEAHLNIKLKYPSGTFPDMRIHDGPGPLSSQVEGELGDNGNIIVHLSSYQAYIKYSPIQHGSIIDAYTKAVNKSDVKPSVLKWCKYIYSATKCPYSYDSRGIHFRRSNQICWIESEFHNVKIHQLVFNGFNIHSHGTYTRNMCQCGGLFITLCDNTIISQFGMPSA